MNDYEVMMLANKVIEEAMGLQSQSKEQVPEPKTSSNKPESKQKNSVSKQR